MSENKGNNNMGKIMRTGIMVVIYIAMFVLISFTKLFDSVFANAPQMRLGLGSLFLIYGLFRAYRLWKTL